MKYCKKCNSSFSSDLTFCPFDGTFMSVPEKRTVAMYDPLAGIILDGRYQIMVPCGDDIFSIHYSAKHISLSKRYTIKFLRSFLCSSENYRSMYLDLSRMRASLEHPGIEKTVDYGIHLEQPYMVCEYTEGDSLDVYIKKNGVNSDISKIMNKLSEALSYVHSKGHLLQNIIHSNVRIKINPDGDMKVVLINPGILQTTRKKILEGSYFGLIEYLPEETLKMGIYDCRSEYYQLGLILRKMLVSDEMEKPESMDSIINGGFYRKLTELENKESKTRFIRYTELYYFLTAPHKDRIGTHEEFKKVMNNSSGGIQRKLLLVSSVIFVLFFLAAVSAVFNSVSSRDEKKSVPEQASRTTVKIIPLEKNISRTGFYTVQIETEPVGARILSNGRQYISPADIEIPSGTELKIKIDRDGYESRELSLHPKGNEKVVISLRSAKREKTVGRNRKKEKSELMDPFKDRK
ncbi:MAG: protein kinase [Deltaproteobacteria bacterium]|nr:protein kinase [Deltaproteobacteria bacterium]